MLGLVDEAEAIVTNPKCPIGDFRRLLNESWKIKRTLTGRITNPAIDEIYEAGLGAGALGGKFFVQGVVALWYSSSRRNGGKLCEFV